MVGDLVEAVAALKDDSGIRRIALSGSTSVVRQLLVADLLDELHLRPPGGGLRFFDDDTPPQHLKLLSATQHLKLLSATPFRTGVVHLVYAADPNPPTGSYDEAKENLPTE